MSDTTVGAAKKIVKVVAETAEKTTETAQNAAPKVVEKSAQMVEVVAETAGNNTVRNRIILAVTATLLATGAAVLIAHRRNKKAEAPETIEDAKAAN